jgi:hypothetical protein
MIENYSTTSFKLLFLKTARVSLVLKTLCCKSEGRGFETDEVNEFLKFT